MSWLKFIKNCHLYNMYNIYKKNNKVFLNVMFIVL